MKRVRKMISVVLCVLLAFSCSVPSFAADANAGEPYPPQAYLVDNALGVLHDLLFGFLQVALRQPGIPSSKKFFADEQPYLYPGTDGAASGESWSGGFSSHSIIPAAWRFNADGKQDPNGRTLKGMRFTGGYQAAVQRLYTDQMLNMIILSNGTDSNRNGKADLLIFSNVDGVGLTAGTVNKMRASVEKSLSGYGVEHDDILSCNFSATHCHAALDTEGMSVFAILLKLLPASIVNCIPALRPRSVAREMEKTLCDTAGKCAVQAFETMETGTLSYFETEPVNEGATDKLDSGVMVKNNFSCFLFEGGSGTKTVLANIGAHPTSYNDADDTGILFADYPYVMAQALRDNDLKINLVFTQSAQANINGPRFKTEPGDDKDVRAEKWASENELTREDWVALWGASFADEQYDEMAETFHEHLRRGFLLADMILDAIETKKELSCELRVKNAQTLLPLDNGLMALAAISGLLEENVVRMPQAESRCGIVVETNYIEIGSSIAIFTAPGELSPSLLLGSDPNYTGDAKWTGVTAWAGEEWQYPTLTQLVRSASGDSDKTVLLFGITNDGMAYIYPDICCTKSFLGALLYYKGEDRDSMFNSMLLTMGTKVASSLMDGYIRVLRDVYS